MSRKEERKRKILSQAYAALPENHRVLGPGEMLQAGDKFWTSEAKKWLVFTTEESVLKTLKAGSWTCVIRSSN